MSMSNHGHTEDSSGWQQPAEDEAALIRWALCNCNRTAQGLQMDINAAYPSKWLRAVDLAGKTVTVTINGVAMEQFQDGSSKPAMFFLNKDKGLILNKTNATAIADAYGGDTDAWTGKQIELFSMKVQGPSGLVDGIRVRIPQSAAPVGPGATEPEDLDDDIPF